MNVLFLCTGNSCRSQMAEGWADYLGTGWLTVRSAGIESHGQNPRAIKVMREAGVDISGQESTTLSDEMLAWADYLVTVCGHADENCPVLPAGLRKEHWPLNDPARATGTEAEILTVFRESCADIRRRVVDLLETPVMLVAVRVVNRSREWYERRDGVAPNAECCPEVLEIRHNT